jgi:hypothetical protein
MVTASERSLTPCFGTVIEQVRERDRANLESRFALLEVCLSSLLFFSGPVCSQKKILPGAVLLYRIWITQAPYLPLSRRSVRSCQRRSGLPPAEDS